MKLTIPLIREALQESLNYEYNTVINHRKVCGHWKWLHKRENINRYELNKPICKDCFGGGLFTYGMKVSAVFVRKLKELKKRRNKK